MEVPRAIAAGLARPRPAAATVRPPIIAEATVVRRTAAARHVPVRRLTAEAAPCRLTMVRRPMVAAVDTTQAAHRLITVVAAEVEAHTVEVAVADRMEEAVEATPAVIANLSDRTNESAARKGGVLFSDQIDQTYLS